MQLTEGKEGVDVVVDGERLFGFSAKARKATAWLRDRCADGPHEAVLTEIVFRFMQAKPDSRFLDVGSLYGYFGLLALGASGGRGKVAFCEMNPRSVQAIRENLAVNPGFAQSEVRVVNAAVSDHVARAAPTHVRGMVVGAEQAKADLVDLDFTTFDALLSDTFGGADLIKLDVEGFEVPVLKVADRVLEADGPIVLMELHSNAMLARHGVSRLELLRGLAARGCHLYLAPEHRRVAAQIELVPLHAEALASDGHRLREGNNDLIVLCGRPLAEDSLPGVRIAA